MIVVDASVVYKWIIDEDELGTRKARILRNQHLLGKQKAIAPDLLLYEIGNILAHKAGLSKADVGIAWKSFLLTEVSFIPTTRVAVEACIRLSLAWGVTVYDAAYVSLATQKRCLLVTADKKLVSRVKLPFVRDLMTF